MIKFFGKLSLFLIVFGLLAHYCRKETEHFTMLRVASDFTFDPAWETRPLQKEERETVQKLFNQKFTFFGKGGQCFVFVSEDETHVLKLFKLYRKRPPFFFKFLPSWFDAYRQKKLASLRGKLLRDFGSHVLAFNELQEESALVFVHLNKTSDLQKKITLVDKLGISHQLDLDKTEFVIQKKAALVYPTLSALIREGKREEAKKRIDALVDLVIFRCKKGIYDDDAYMRNFGFMGDKAIILDAGRLRKDPAVAVPERYLNELLVTTQRLQPWLDRHDPDLAVYLLEKRSSIE
jgi:hypothetical protein